MPDFEQVAGRQYVLENEYERISGIWLIPQPGEEIDLPVVIGGV